LIFHSVTLLYSVYGTSGNEITHIIITWNKIKKTPRFNLLNYVYEFKTHRFQSEQKTNYPIPKGKPITTYNHTQLIVPNLSSIH